MGPKHLRPTTTSAWILLTLGRTRHATSTRHSWNCWGTVHSRISYRGIDPLQISFGGLSSRPSRWMGESRKIGSRLCTSWGLHHPDACHLWSGQRPTGSTSKNQPTTWKSSPTLSSNFYANHYWGRPQSWPTRFTYLAHRPEAGLDNFQSKIFPPVSREAAANLSAIHHTGRFSDGPNGSILGTADPCRPHWLGSESPSVADDPGNPSETSTKANVETSQKLDPIWTWTPLLWAMLWTESLALHDGWTNPSRTNGGPQNMELPYRTSSWSGYSTTSPTGTWTATIWRTTTSSPRTLSNSKGGANALSKAIETGLERPIHSRSRCWHHETPADGEASAKDTIFEVSHPKRRSSSRLAGKGWDSVTSRMDSHSQSCWIPWGFDRWVASKPELFLPQDLPPDASQLYDMEQLLLFEVRHLAYQERQRKKESRVFATWLDREKGHLQQSFRRLREPPTGVLHQVHQQLTTTAEEISHNGTGLVTMKIQQKLPLRPDLQVQVQGHCATLTEYQFPIVEVMLEDADVELEREGKLQQEIATSEPVQIAEALSSFWNRYWRRDDVQRQETLEAWPEFTDLMQTLPPLPQMAVEEDDFRQWKASALSMKSQSSRGICGWYADELRFLAKAERPLRDLLRCFAHMDRFPAWMMQARIIPVKKHDQAETASAIRPITVLAMIYRYWARTTSRRMLRWWALHWPISISGFLPHRSPNHLVYHVQHEIEKIHNNIEERQLGGLTLDLIKAFNQLPQQPARALLLRLGVPQLWVTIWFNSITTMARWWHASGSLHSAGTGTTGFPEGDPWSVNAMLTINRLWVHLIDHPDLVANSYADNWAYAVYNPEVHEEAIANTVRLTRAIRVQIDWNKTWGWSTDEQHKNALQRVANQMLPPTVTLQMVPHARELGYIMHYTGLTLSSCYTYNYVITHGASYWSYFGT